MPERDSTRAIISLSRVLFVSSDSHVTLRPSGYTVSIIRQVTFPIYIIHIRHLLIISIILFLIYLFKNYYLVIILLFKLLDIVKIASIIVREINE